MIELSAVFYDGKLFQIGDLVTGKGEYLDNRYGFTKLDTGGYITKIIVEKDVLCNSLYLNHGITYNAICGLSYVFELDGKKHYAFENKNLVIPTYIKEKRQYFTSYYLLDLNSDKLNNLLKFLKKEHDVELTAKQILKIGDIISKEYKIIFDYFFLCLMIRGGKFGKFHNSTELSDITFNVLKDNGMLHNSQSYLYRLTSENSTNPDTNNSYYKQA